MKKIGRPLSFDRDEALYKAMLLFWQHGYEATSLNDITTALGIKPSSVYSAFGDKKGLFLDAIALYLSGPVTAEMIIEQAVSGYDAAHSLLNTAAVGFTGTNTPRGCLLASSVTSCSTAADDVKMVLATIRRAIEERLCFKISQSVLDKQLPVDTDADGLAAMTMTVIQGMSTLARDGATREKLLRVSQLAMRSWPINCTAPDCNSAG